LARGILYRLANRDISDPEPGRPSRGPIDAEEISARSVMSIGFGLLAFRVALMMPFGASAVLCGLLLAGVIVLYDVSGGRQTRGKRAHEEVKLDYFLIYPSEPARGAPGPGRKGQEAR
jgi:hypothetical protein